MYLGLREQVQCVGIDGFGQVLFKRLLPLPCERFASLDYFLSLRWLQGLDVLVSAQRIDHDRVQLLSSDLGLEEITVDLVLQHDISLRCHAGLSGSQNDL